LSEQIEFIDVTIPSVPGRTEKKYRMKYARWKQDMAFERESLDPHGDINTTALWIKRLTAAVSDATTGNPLTEEQISKMERWEMNALIMYWIKLNEVPTSFLAMSQQEEKSKS